MINFSQLFTCQKTEIYEKIKSEQKYIDTTILSVLIDSDGNLLFLLGSICYGITVSTKAFYSLCQNNHITFMILQLSNHLQGNYQLIIKQNFQLLISCLKEKCQVTSKQKIFNQKILTPNEDKNFPKKWPQTNQQKIQQLQIGFPSSQSDDKYIKASKSLGKGMYMVGKLISKGIAAIGSFVANNIQPSKELKLSQSTKQNLKQANQLTTKVFDFASGSVKKLINYGRQVALDSVNQKQVSQSIEEQKFVNNLKNGAVTGVKVFINLYDGFVEAGDEVKNGAFKAGGDILKKKYGVQAEEALKNVAGGVNNVIKIYKLPKASVKYLFTVEKNKQ